jgi:hypothetical protein
VSIDEELLEQRRRRAGDPRLTDADREILRRITTGDLADAFAQELDATAEADPMLSGSSDVAWPPGLPDETMLRCP